jgi:hypothetical protein
MQINHDYLLQMVKRLSEDYKPFGEVERWANPEAEYPDCSMGCKYYLQLKGELGNDWGVCSNRNSHRYGLLTFEHQGCQKFKFDKENNLE